MVYGVLFVSIVQQVRSPLRVGLKAPDTAGEWQTGRWYRATEAKVNTSLHSGSQNPIHGISIASTKGTEAGGVEVKS